MTLDTRATAAGVVGEVLAGKSLNQVLPAQLPKVAARDRGLLQQLCYGTLRQAPRLQAFLTQLLNKPLRDKDSDVQGLLLVGLYQLGMTRVPDHAAVDSCVRAAAALKKPWARGLTNAVLRRYLRESAVLEQALDDAAASAHPAWLYGKLHSQWPEAADQVIQANNQQPPMHLRVNALSTSRDAYLRLLADAGIDAHPGEAGEQSIYLGAPVDVEELPGFREGLVSVQDEAAQLAAQLLDAPPGDEVLDACAAPGGKTCHILERTPDIGGLLAMDSDETRLVRVADNLARLQLQAELTCGDATSPTPELQARSFDRILVDAPCSASGVIRRHPDIKVLRRASDIEQFAAQQRAILHGLWPLLKTGGKLLYVTCSVFREENSDVVAAFLAANNDAATLPPGIPAGERCEHGLQLLPNADTHDGLFYALLHKLP
ncbi:MAG: 16S rRNA (cytosine(967)-C(5))-methyltransferase RsmB [Halioglobus sp.]